MPTPLARLQRPEPTRVILYARVSRDQRSGRSVDQQLKIGRQQATERGWDIIAERSDNDQSASQYARGAREDWPKVEELIRDGQADILWLWELSRGTRDRVVWAHLAEACQAHRMWIGLDGDLWDTTNPDHMKYLDSMMIDAIHESGKTRTRINRDLGAQADAGRPHGKLHFAYRREYDPESGELLRQVPRPDRVKFIMEIRRRLREDRESMSSIIKDLNAQRVPTPQGKVYGQTYEVRGRSVVSRGWTTGTIQHLFDSTTLMGHRSHHGELKPQGWDAVLTPSEWEEMQDLVHPSRSQPAGRVVRSGLAESLLGGVALCDPCGSVMYLQPTDGRRPAYRCGMQSYQQTKGHVWRSAAPLDEQMSGALLERFADPDVLSAFDTTGSSPNEVAGARAELSCLEKELEELYADVTSGAVSRRMAQADEVRLLEGIKAARARTRPRLVDPLLEELAAGSSDAVTHVWEGWSLQQRRAALSAATVEVRILRVGNVGRRKVPRSESVRIVWAGVA